MKPLRKPEKFRTFHLAGLTSKAVGKTHAMNINIFMKIAVLFMLTGSSYGGEIKPTIIRQPAEAMTYRNRQYHFSFTLPSGWEKQSGGVSSDNALFMQMPLATSCSFQFNVTPMPSNFPVESTVNAGLSAARRQVRLTKLLSVKRRTEYRKEKVLEKGKEVEKLVLLVRGWEFVEKPQPQTLQRIVYQTYNRENYYFNFVAAAISENFSQCSPQLQQIIDSISFAANPNPLPK
jgi:hypothetical protein